MHRRTRHDRRYGVLVDELRVTVAAQQHAEIIEPRHDTLQFHPVDQKYRQWRLVPAYMVQERVLKTLGSFGHCCCPLLVMWKAVAPPPIPPPDKMQNHSNLHKQIRRYFKGQIASWQISRASGTGDFRCRMKFRPQLERQ